MNESTQNPMASTLEEFLEFPLKYCPRPEFLSACFYEDDTALTNAIRQQNADAVDVLIQSGADPNLLNRKGVTPISVAAHKGNIRIMNCLIYAGSNVNALNSSGSTALIQASHFGNLESVKLLLQCSATADFANLKGTTALMRASQEGHVEISRILIHHTADVNRKNLEGMNALMLASQRGHAEMVALLIRAGAAMDEQTSQGSTALMLACKRGHERCVEVLVTMGSEIFIRDTRSRTARDTATRRNHLSLLNWLDTQVQIKQMQICRREHRTEQLYKLKDFFLENKLELNPTDSEQMTMIDSIHRNPYFLNQNDRLEALAAAKPWPQSLQKIRPKQYDWEWSKILQRAMGLPMGIFDLIVEFMPLPRVWQWSMWRLRERCKLAPHQAIKDLCIIADEILCDAEIFKGRDQTNLLIRISQNAEVEDYLVHFWGMSKALTENLSTWSDLQSLAFRTSEVEVTLKPKFARDLYRLVSNLFKWQRTKSHCGRALENYFLRFPKLLQNVEEKFTDFGAMRGELGSLRGESHLLAGSSARGLEDGDLIEATDAGGEEDLSVSDVDNMLDQETETEMIIDGDGDDGRFEDADEDSEEDPSELSIMHMVGYGFT